LANLLPSEQLEFREILSDDFFKNLLRLSKTKDDVFLRFYTQSLIPARCIKESVATLEKFIQKNPKLPPIVMKNLRVAHEEDERCVKIHEFSSKP